MGEVSIVRLAKDLSVTPALIHYYLDGGRDALTSGIINRFYAQVLKKWPTPDGDWRQQVTEASKHINRQLIRYPGIASYLKMHNRFRVFQLVRPGETDFGVLFLEKLIGVMCSAQLPNERTGILSHLMMEFLLSSAHNTAHYRWPKEHLKFLEEKLSSLDPEQFPNLIATGYLVGRLDSEQAFENGLNLFIQGLDSERRLARKRSK